VDAEAYCKGQRVTGMMLLALRGVTLSRIKSEGTLHACLIPLNGIQKRILVCFARKVCHFAMKGLPLGLQETRSGFWGRSTGRDERATSYQADAIMRPVISQKRSIARKVCLIVTKVCREKSIWQPKSGKMPRNFVPFLTARVCFRFPTTAKLSDNVRTTCG
jgi:hypothetical protein